jgi:adenine-specific DNA-methyltransferase
MWRLLRSRALDGYKFRRQYIIGTYITDFCCVERNLVIELDGGQHQNRRVYDERRTRFLESEGYTVLRFWDNEVLKEPDAVLNMILDTLEAPSDKTTLSPQEGRGPRSAG